MPFGASKMADLMMPYEVICRHDQHRKKFLKNYVEKAKGHLLNAK